MRQKRIRVRNVELLSVFLFADFIFSAPIFSSQLDTSETKPLGKYAQCSSEPINHIYPNTQQCQRYKKTPLVRLCRHHFTLFHRGFDFMLPPRAPTFTHTHTHSVSCRHSWLSGTIGVNLARTAVTSGAHTHTHINTERQGHTHLFSHTHSLFSSMRPTLPLAMLCMLVAAEVNGCH